MALNHLRAPQAADSVGVIQLPVWGSTPITAAIGATALAATTLNGAQAIRFYSSVDCYLKFGDDAVEAAGDLSDSVFMPAGVEMMSIPLDATHFSVIRASGDGNCQIVPLG